MTTQTRCPHCTALLIGPHVERCHECGTHVLEYLEVAKRKPPVGKDVKP